MKRLDNKPVLVVSPYLSNLTDTSKASRVTDNLEICFEGVKPGNSEFVLSEEQAFQVVSQDSESSGVIRKLLIARDLARNIDQSPSRYVIDFHECSEAEAQQYTGAFQYAQSNVFPARTSELQRKPNHLIENWWIFERTRPEMRQAISRFERVLVIARVSPYLLFSFMDTKHLADSRLKVLALDQMYHFGLLQSGVHEYWAWARGSTLEERLSYTNTTIFETFPFPLLDSSDPFGEEDTDSKVDAGNKVDAGTKVVGRASVPASQNAEGQNMADAEVRPTGLSYNPRAVPDTPQARRVSEVAGELYEKRQAACRALNLGLTKLYNLIKNKRAKGDPDDPDFDVVSNLTPEHAELIIKLRALHENLNAAVCACYGWPEDTWRDENEVLSRLLRLNLALTAEPAAPIS